MEMRICTYGKGVYMVLLGIMENDLDSCNEIINSDKELIELDREFYSLLNQLDDSLKIKLEDIYSSYNSRVMRIGYLQGFKDFYKMCVELNSSTEELIEKLNNVL